MARTEAPKRTKAVTPKKRVRRTPEDARALILDAAEGVFRARLPDAVGLVDVARAAGVSHALITHYFGTYEALVEAALERRVGVVREQLVAAAVKGFSDQADTGSLLVQYREALASAVTDPVTVRLAVWAVLSGRSTAADFFPARGQGLRVFADMIVAREGPTTSRERVEFALVTSFSMIVTWSLGKKALLAAMGKKPGSETDEWFEEELGKMLRAYLKG